MILHIDMDAFYASIEQRDTPALKGKPVVVGGSPKGRGVIAAASYEARKYGLHSAMPASQAARRCPQVVFVKPRMQVYADVSRKIRSIFYQYTSLIEPLSLDEAFLDVTGCERLFGDGPTIAAQIKQQIATELNLTASAGVAPNKFLAKVASDLNKPNGLTIVPSDAVQEFLDPLDVSRVWGVGPKTIARLAATGINTVKQLRTCSAAQLAKLFGDNASHFLNLARGIDDRQVVPDRIAKSVSHESTFSADINDDDALAAWLHELTDQVGRRLRRNKIKGRTLVLKVREEDFTTITRSRTLRQSTSSTAELWRSVQPVLAEVRSTRRRPVRLLGFGVKELSRKDKFQKDLFDREKDERIDRMEAASDKIKDSFGDSALTTGSNLDHSIKFRRRQRPS